MIIIVVVVGIVVNIVVVGNDFVAVAIGPSSLRAAEEAGFREVYAPQGDSGPVSQGMEPWARLISKIASQILTTHNNNRNSVRGAAFWRDEDEN